MLEFTVRGQHTDTETGTLRCVITTRLHTKVEFPRHVLWFCDEKYYNLTVKARKSGIISHSWIRPTGSSFRSSQTSVIFRHADEIQVPLLELVDFSKDHDLNGTRLFRFLP